jgi:uncharacterized membrane-anchored protein YhcB (DUF1043 family)
MTRLEIAAHVARTNTLLETIAASQEKTEQHLATQNGRLRKAEASVTRLNLVVFGIGGPSALAMLVWFLR